MIQVLYEGKYLSVGVQLFALEFALGMWYRLWNLIRCPTLKVRITEITEIALE